VETLVQYRVREPAARRLCVQLAGILLAVIPLKIDWQPDLFALEHSLPHPCVREKILTIYFSGEVMANNASDVLMETLIDWGVDTIFGIPGDGINGLMEVLRQR
jgi:hypothetical protein